MEMNKLNAVKFYGSAIEATRPEKSLGLSAPEASSGDSFIDGLLEAAKETKSAVTAGEETAEAMMSGKADAHSVVEALAAAEMAVEMAVAVRNKVVEAYQEILRMPI